MRLGGNEGGVFWPMLQVAARQDLAWDGRYSADGPCFFGAKKVGVRTN